ncbi:hypothetical protein AB0F45_25410, partial [Streptomyces achromogenes]
LTYASRDVLSRAAAGPAGPPPKLRRGDGQRLNQSVVITFLLLFFVNMVMTVLYLRIVPPKGG